MSYSLSEITFNGSHLSWQAFRAEVLASHQIQFLDSPPFSCLPASVLHLFRKPGTYNDRLEPEKVVICTKWQCDQFLRGTQILPLNLLLGLTGDLKLAECETPILSFKPLPRSCSVSIESFYKLSPPLPELARGFSASAFSDDEKSVLPEWLGASESPHSQASVNCPFLTFERIRGTTRGHLEAARNQCAINGAWCIKALRLLYQDVYGAQPPPTRPMAFTAAISNNISIINCHWLERGKGYCMAPLFKFDLSSNSQLAKYLQCVEAICKWGICHLLPSIKAALHGLLRKAHYASSTSVTASALNHIKDDSRARAPESFLKYAPWRDDTLTMPSRSVTTAFSTSSYTGSESRASDRSLAVNEAPRCKGLGIKADLSKIVRRSTAYTRNKQAGSYVACQEQIFHQTSKLDDKATASSPRYQHLKTTKSTTAVLLQKAIPTLKPRSRSTPCLRERTQKPTYPPVPKLPVPTELPAEVPVAELPGSVPWTAPLQSPPSPILRPAHPPPPEIQSSTVTVELVDLRTPIPTPGLGASDIAQLRAHQQHSSPIALLIVR